jgi:hypothetical protein
MAFLSPASADQMMTYPAELEEKHTWRNFAKYAIAYLVLFGKPDPMNCNGVPPQLTHDCK